MRAEREWLGPNDLAWFTRLRRECSNLRATLEFCLTEPDQARAGPEVTPVLFQHWIRSCSHTNARNWLDQALKQARVLAQQLWDEPTLAHTTPGFDAAAFSEIDLHHTVTLLEDALAHHQMLDDPTPASSKQDA